MRSEYTDDSIFLALENTKNVMKRHDFFFLSYISGLYTYTMLIVDEAVTLRIYKPR